MFACKNIACSRQKQIESKTQKKNLEINSVEREKETKERKKKKRNSNFLFAKMNSKLFVKPTKWRKKKKTPAYNVTFSTYTAAIWLLCECFFCTVYNTKFYVQ